MKKWRCINNLLGYCSSEPEFAESKEEVVEVHEMSVSYDELKRVCIRDHNTCRKFQTFSKLVKNPVK